VKITKRKIHFQTPWFEVEGKTIEGEDEVNSGEFYSLKARDYVCIVAMTAEDEIVLVKQFRPAVEDYTLELPSGYVEKGEGPVQAAIRELSEETGYACSNPNLVGCLFPDTGRLANRQWCVHGSAVPLMEAVHEPGITTVLLSKRQLKDYIATGKFNHSLHLAAIFLSIVNEKISL